MALSPILQIYRDFLPFIVIFSCYCDEMDAFSFASSISKASQFGAIKQANNKHSTRLELSLLHISATSLDLIAVRISGISCAILIPEDSLPNKYFVVLSIISIKLFANIKYICAHIFESQIQDQEDLSSPKIVYDFLDPDRPYVQMTTLVEFCEIFNFGFTHFENMCSVDHSSSNISLIPLRFNTCVFSWRSGGLPILIVTYTWFPFDIFFFRQMTVQC